MFPMTDQKPASRSNATLWVIIPFVAAVIGTVVMLFTNSANALKIALIFALWAGAAGVIVSRDRTRAQEEAERSEQLLADARLKLEERATVPAPAQAPAQAPAPEIDMELLRDLQAEIQALRAQLEEMRGAAFEYEPAALRASARRIPEIEEPHPEPAPEPEPAPAPRPGPSTDDTTRIAPVAAPGPSRRARPAGAPSADAVAGRLGSQPAREHPNPLSALISEREAEKAQPKAEAQTQPRPEPEPKAEPQPEHRHEDHRGGRRRRDEQGEAGVSVAELMARQQRSE